MTKNRGEQSKSASHNLELSLWRITSTAEILSMPSLVPLGLKNMLRERSVRRRVLALSCLIIVGVIIGATLITLNGSQATSAASFYSASTGSPSTSPTLISSEIEQVAIAISGTASVFTIGTPQNRAVGWMSSEDLLDTHGLGLLFTQRYILIVFYFATNGEKWLEHEKWLSPDLHVCDWGIGIICCNLTCRERCFEGFG